MLENILTRGALSNALQFIGMREPDQNNGQVIFVFRRFYVQHVFLRRV